MRLLTLLFLLMSLGGRSYAAEIARTNETKTFIVKGILKEIRGDGQTLVIQHEAIPGYMDAMTMPFHAKPGTNLSTLKAYDQVQFRLNVDETKSWIDQIVKTGEAQPATNTPTATQRPADRGLSIGDPMPDYTLTNELGQPVTFRQFRGNAFAFTFFFTRCPLPNYCPRLSQNFADATVKLKAAKDAPTNWHFFSITFDPQHDTPTVLKEYAEKYNYDPAHWSFLTGSKSTIEAITHQFGFNYAPDSGFFSHNFITVIVDKNGILKTAWPISGDISDTIVTEIIKAAKPEPVK